MSNLKQKLVKTPRHWKDRLSFCFPAGSFVGDGRTDGRPLAAPVAAVSGALDSSEDRLSGHALGVAGQAKETHEVDETGGQIELPAVLTGGVVEGERMVVIMEAFTYGTEGDKSVLPGVNGAVVGPVSPHVCGAVDQPGGV